MGHDITARRNGIEVAYNRRAAGNPLNQVLYLALGVMDEAYAGCSGDGCELHISLEQFRAAKEVLEKKSFAGMTREPNAFDDVMRMFSDLGFEVDANKLNDGNIIQEKEFVEKCIRCLLEENANDLVVRFS